MEGPTKSGVAGRRNRLSSNNALAKEIVGQESWRCESVAGKGDAAASPGRNVPIRRVHLGDERRGPTGAGPLA